jgi:uncharacterized membrane protein YkvA (DUF1232 family)
LLPKLNESARGLINAQAKTWTQEIIARLSMAKQKGSSIETAPERLHEASKQLELGIDLIQDVRTGRYREISWPAALVMSSAILYVVSPEDLVPDTISGLGALDDIIVLTLATRFAETELKKYCISRGYNASEYFPSEDVN